MATTDDRSDPGLRTIRPDGQQQNYLVLSQEERDKGYVRPVRINYVHIVCGTETRMPVGCAETYARKPDFYTGTFCCSCGKHFPLEIDGVRQFKWDDGTGVGT